MKSYFRNPFYLSLLGLFLLAGALCALGIVTPAEFGAAGFSLAMAGAGTESVTKLTMKTMEAQPSMEDLAKLEKKTGAENYLALCRIFGIAKKFKPGSSEHGPFVKFLGQFKGTNLRTKAEYVSGAMLMPKMIEEGLFAVMDAEGVNDIQFAFEIGCKFDKSAATKYVYTAKALTKAAENDPLALLEKQVLQALPAPKKD